MFNISNSPKLAGMAFGALNILRVFNIISLLCAMVAPWIMIIMAAITGQSSPTVFFDATSQFLVFAWALFLMFTELTFIKFTRKWIHTNFPVFSYEHSFLWFGIMMMALGCAVLSNLSRPAVSADIIGAPWRAAIIAAGSLNLIFGFFNIVVSIIFRDPTKGITSRMLRSKGNLAGNTLPKDYYDDHNSQRMHEDSYENSYEKEATKPNAFKRLTQKFNPMKSKPQISAPIHNNVRNDDVETGRRSFDNESWDNDRRSPVMPDIERPPTALHPAYTGGNRSSQYSEARMSRFTRHDGKAF